MSLLRTELMLSIFAVLFVCVGLSLGATNEGGEEKDESRYAISMTSNLAEDGTLTIEYVFKNDKRHGVDNSLIKFQYGRTIPRQLSTQQRSGLFPAKDGSLKSKVTVTIKLIAAEGEGPQKMGLKIQNDQASTSQVFKLENSFEHVDDLVTRQVEGGTLKVGKETVLLKIDGLPIYFELETDHPSYDRDRKKDKPKD